MWAALVAMAASAALPTVFGLQLGAPVTLPECARVVAAIPDPGRKPPYRPDQTETCQQSPGEHGQASANSGAVVFQVGRRPEIVGSDVIGTTIIGGSLEGISAVTLSHNVSEEIVRQLSGKFGPPTGRGVETVEVDHIPVQAAWARWDRAGFAVEYHAIDDRMENGLLIVETAKAKAARLAREKAADATRTPL